MNEQFIQDNFCDAEISQILKEVGFNEPCLGVWCFDQHAQELGGTEWELLLVKSRFGPDTKNNSEVQKGNVAAPLYQQACAFFASKGIHITEDAGIVGGYSIFMIKDGFSPRFGISITEALKAATIILKQQNT